MILDCSKHTREPDPARPPPLSNGYAAWIDFATEMSKTHAQVRCEQCGLWEIWLPKAEARAVNKRAAAETRRVCAAYQRAFDRRTAERLEVDRLAELLEAAG